MRLRFIVALCVALAPIEARADSRAEARRYFNRGMEAIDTGRAREGIDLLLKAYEIRPHPNVLFNVGRAYASLNDVDRAISYFERYLKSEPADAEKTERLVAELKDRQRLRQMVDEGMAAISAGRHREGVALLERAYAERPHPNLLYNIARAREGAGDLDAAIEGYKQYLASNPPDAASVEARIEALAERLEKARPPIADRPKRPSRPEPEIGQMDEEERVRRLAERIAELLRDKPVKGVGAKESEPVTIKGARSSSTTVDAEVTVAAKETAGYEEVVVTASRREQSPLDAPNAVTIITEDDIRLSGARTIPDLLRRVPGMDVMAMSYGDYNVAMRGFNRRIANKLLVLIDGRSVYLDFLGLTLWAAFPIDLMDIERIEVVRGPGSAIYGAYAYTGMVNIITKRPSDLRGSTVRAGGGNGAVVDAAYQYGERKGPFGVRLSGGYEQADKYELEFDPNRVDYSTVDSDPNLGLRRIRFDGQGEYHTKAGYFFAGGGVSDIVQEVYGVQVLRNQRIDGLIADARVGFEGELFSVHAFWTGVRTDTSPTFFRAGVPSLGSRVHSDTFSVEPLFRPSFELGGEHALVLGAEYRHKYIDWDYLDSTHREDHFAIFAQDSWSIGKALTALASGRLDKHPVIGFTGSPRLALIFKPGEGHAIRASVGTAFRQPTLSEVYLELAAASPVAGVAVELIGGKDQLGPERIATVDVGYLNQSDFGEVEVVAYLNRVADLIDASVFTRAPVSRGFDDSVGAYIGAEATYLNQDKAFIAVGSELSTRVYPIDGVDLGASYAFQYIVDQDTGDRRTDSPMHKISAWAQLRTKPGFDFGVSLHFVSRQEWVEPVVDPNEPSGFDRTPLPVDASLVIIARAGYRLLEDRLEIGISGTNLADTGGNRHFEHPFANRMEARVFGSVTARF
jgi:iron complex outermembrane recepter protein